MPAYSVKLRRPSSLWTLLIGVTLIGLPRAFADDLREPYVFRSSNGVLDLLMIATSKPVPGVSFTAPHHSTVIHPTGWVYEICPRAIARQNNQCPPGSETIASYGGVRWALQPGDVLKVRLVNRLPKLDPDKLSHTTDPGGANLWRNLTNLHTHGLRVPARPASATDRTFGDYVFVQIYNSANGKPTPQDSHNHGSVVPDYADYRIDITPDHPPGAFWFHPHVHGIALNQLSSGLSGIISIGEAGDYARSNVSNAPFPERHVRHLILKDMQVVRAGKIQFRKGDQTVTKDVIDGEVLNQEDPTFCSQSPSELRHGACPGADNSAAGSGNRLDNNYMGGRWYFTINGQEYPTIPVETREGELWRLTNASGSASYNLQLTDDATGMPLTVQLISVDGVTITAPSGSGAVDQAHLSAQRFRFTPCPPSSSAATPPVCVSQFIMMPSSRIELWVTYRDTGGRVVKPPKGATAKLTSLGITTGPAGDSWPEVDLAKITFVQPAPSLVATSVLDLKGPRTVAKTALQMIPSSCMPTALPAGHRRRIFFGLMDTNNQDSFGLGYEEIDGSGNPVSSVSVTSFDPNTTTICLPLAPGQSSVHEIWELVNLATETHNFHIHQARFTLQQSSQGTGAFSAENGSTTMDNVPLPIATPNIIDVANSQNGYCTMQQWHGHQCDSTPVVVDIEFSEPGEFVFHCHILEHEDGGMMAKIQVVSTAN
jgi:L-ascorbate oxidase